MTATQWNDPDVFASLMAVFSGVQATDGQAAPMALDQAVERFVGMTEERAGRGARVFYIGNGASQSIAGHMVADSVKNGGIRAMTFSDPSLLTCVGNDLGYEQVFATPLGRFAEDGDMLVAISSSGRSPNILAAVVAARSAGCAVVTLSGFDEGNPLRGLGDVNFYAPSHEYGEVEVVHHGICHCALDRFIQKRVTGG